MCNLTGVSLRPGGKVQVGHQLAAWGRCEADSSVARIAAAGRATLEG